VAMHLVEMLKENENHKGKSITSSNTVLTYKTKEKLRDTTTNKEMKRDGYIT
jgi:hypothetical protein